jgi:hypothetical protein
MDHVHHVLTLFSNQNCILSKDKRCFYKNLKTGETFEREHGFSEGNAVSFKKSLRSKDDSAEPLKDEVDGDHTMAFEKFVYLTVISQEIACMTDGNEMFDPQVGAHLVKTFSNVDFKWNYFAFYRNKKAFEAVVDGNDFIVQFMDGERVDDIRMTVEEVRKKIEPYSPNFGKDIVIDESQHCITGICKDDTSIKFNYATNKIVECTFPLAEHEIKFGGKYLFFAWLIYQGFNIENLRSINAMIDASAKLE